MNWAFFGRGMKVGEIPKNCKLCSLVSGKILVTTGWPSSTSVKTESSDLVASATCQSIPAYPLSVGGATGAFVNSRVVICGGTPYTNQCYSLGQNENAWTPSANLTTPRGGAASVEMNNKLVIFGGYTGDTYIRLQSTEEIDVGTGTATTGPSMPLAIGWHCAVKLNATTALIVGGYGTNWLKSSYFYNSDEESFTAGPLLKHARGSLACSVLNTGTESYVVVAGGYNGAFLDSTEYMDLNDPTSWKTGL